MPSGKGGLLCILSACPSLHHPQLTVSQLDCGLLGGTKMGPDSAPDAWVWAEGLAGDRQVPNKCPDALREAQMGEPKLRASNCFFSTSQRL